MKWMLFSAAVVFVSVHTLQAQTTVDVKGGAVTGGTVTGGTVTESSVTGGSVTGGNVTGGSVTGATVTGGAVQGGTVTSGSVGAATATANVNGRQISARVEGSVSVQSDSAGATVTMDGHKLKVENDRILLDGQERAKLPAHTNKVDIEAMGGKLTVRANNTEVWTTVLKK